VPANPLSVTSLKRFAVASVFAATAVLSGFGASPAWGRTTLSIPVGHQATTVSQQSDATTTTVLLTGPSPDEGGGVIPLPNSGVKPQSSGDRGGWVQLMLWALITVGLGSMFGRIAWGIYKHGRANPVA
jgi:hypothetical protein